jgi:hypothetical protein
MDDTRKQIASEVVRPQRISGRGRGVDGRQGLPEGGLRAGVEFEQHLLKGELHVGGRERLSIMPLPPRAEVEPVERPCLLDLLSSAPAPRSDAEAAPWIGRRPR